jgi:hypothetical protein
MMTTVKLTNFTPKIDDFNFSVVKLPLQAFKLHPHMEYVSLSRCDILELVVRIKISVMEGYC